MPAKAYLLGKSKCLQRHCLQRHSCVLSHFGVPVTILTSAEESFPFFVCRTTRLPTMPAASEDFKKRLEAGCAVITSLIDAYEADGRNLINNLIDDILKVLIDQGLAYRQRFKPQFVGVHKCNRGGTGLISSTMQALLDFIVRNGWSNRAVSRASAFEVKPGSQEQQRFNETLVEGSSGQLGAITHELKVVTTECSHTTASLNAVRTGAVALYGTIADTEGKLSLSRLQERSPSHAAVIEEGIEYLVVRWEVEENIPKLPEYLSLGGNVEHEAFQHESSWQVLFHIHQRANVEGSPKWDEIRKAMVIQKPSLKDSIEAMCNFVRTWSGGRSAPLLHAVDDYIKTLPKTRKVRAEVFNGFAELSLSENPVYVEACFKAMHNSPDSFVDSATGYVRLLNSADITAMEGRLKAQVTEACKVLRSAREVAAACKEHVDQAIIAKELGLLDLRVVMRVHGKEKGKKYESFGHIGFVFFQALRKVAGSALPCASPWSAPVSATTAQESGSREMRELAIGGGSLTFETVVRELASKGIKQGSIQRHEARLSSSSARLFPADSAKCDATNYR